MTERETSIVVVEDDPAVGALLELLLEERGYRVLSFRNGQEALSWFLRQERPPALSLIDWTLPGLDGLSLCRALRVRYGKGELPIVLISGRSGEDSILRGLEAGANDYLLKPFHTPLLVSKVAHLVQREVVPPQASLEGLPRVPCRFGRYRLLSEVGAGTSGVVYSAYRLEDELRVALKLLAPQGAATADALTRFMREVSLVSSLELPNLVRFVDAGQARGRYYLATEWIAGESAQQRLGRVGRFPLHDALRLGRDLARAIVGLSERGLVHRDVKPANAVITPGGEAVLIDLGIARQLSAPALTDPDEVLGSLPYLAPELILGAPEYPGLDLFGLGVTLYTLLTGQFPFRLHSLVDLLQQAEKPPRAPLCSDLRDDVSPPLARSLARLHEPDRGSRERDPVAALELLEEAYAEATATP